MSGLHISIDNGVCTAVIDNPSQLNALNRDVMDGLIAVCAQVEADPSIRVLVLTGTGRAFCAGAEIDMLLNFDSLADSRSYINATRAVYAALEQLSKPTIAAVNGFAFGGGFELCLTCDLVISSAQAEFATPEVRLGAIPGFAVVRLPELIGRIKAAELMMLGDRISATEAERIGLVNKVVPHDELMDVVTALAGRLSAGPPLALQAIKETMRGSSTGKDQTLFLNTASGILVSNDAKNGMRAFVDKQLDGLVFEGR